MHDNQIKFLIAHSEMVDIIQIGSSINHSLKIFNFFKESKIDIIELGFRFLKNSFYGDFAYTDDKFLSSLDLPDNIDFAVMINAKEFLEDKNSISKNISNTFNKKTESKISIKELKSILVILKRQSL